MPGAGGVAGGLAARALHGTAQAVLGPFGLVLGESCWWRWRWRWRSRRSGFRPANGCGWAVPHGPGRAAWRGVGAAGLSRAGGVGARGAVGLFARIGQGVTQPVPLPPPPPGRPAAGLPGRPCCAPPMQRPRPRAGRGQSRGSRRRPVRRRAAARAPQAGQASPRPRPPAKRGKPPRQELLPLQRQPLAPAAAVAAAGTAGQARRAGPSEEALQANARLLEQVLDDYGVRGRIAAINPGPVVTLYELEPAPGTKSPASSAWPTTSPATCM